MPTFAGRLSPRVHGGVWQHSTPSRVSIWGRDQWQGFLGFLVFVLVSFVGIRQVQPETEDQRAASLQGLGGVLVKSVAKRV